MSSKIIKKPFLSVIIPLFNEEQRISNIVHVKKYLKRKKFSYEIILVNDGSHDNTFFAIKKYKKQKHFKLITYNKNRGKGYAVKQGMLASKGSYRLFTDIDLSTPIKEFDKFIPYLKNNDVIIATRKQKNSEFIKRQPILREMLGKGFTFLSQVILRVSFSDFTCGFKCFSEKAINKIFVKQKIERWGFDSEILYLTKKDKLRVKEITVSWTNDTRTRVKFPKDIIISFIELMKIIYYDYRRYYD